MSVARVCINVDRTAAMLVLTAIHDIMKVRARRRAARRASMAARARCTLTSTHARAVPQRRALSRGCITIGRWAATESASSREVEQLSAGASMTRDVTATLVHARGASGVLPPFPRPAAAAVHLRAN
eukprot:1081943-Pleurochrysis_carterae.AAC.1